MTKFLIAYFFIIKVYKKLTKAIKIIYQIMHLKTIY